MHKVNLNGFEMLLQGDNYLEQEIIKTGVWERQTSAVFKEIIQPGMVIVDIGANIGYFSFLSAILSGPTGSVHAFEPCPEYRKRMLNSLECNCFDQIRVMPYALSDKKQQRNLYKGLASARMEKWTHADPVFNKIHDVIVVDCMTLDDYSSQNLSRLDVLKIDVDGHEVNVVNGGRNTIEKYKPVIVIELYEPALNDAGTSVTELLDIFEELNYVPYSEQGDLCEYELLKDYVISHPERSINIVLVG